MTLFPASLRRLSFPPTFGAPLLACARIEGRLVNSSYRELASKVGS
jgi:hypothetical protein